MDKLSEELQDFLIKFGKNPHCVNEKTEHYLKHILHLLTSEDEVVFQMYYGLSGSEVHPLDDIAYKRGVSPDTMMKIIEADLRKLAITPEWQMVKQLINK